MKFSLLTTKLQKPQLPNSVISRYDLLKGSMDASVILVSAQAGSGKSTVVSNWLSELNRAYCWYSLDDWDNDLMQFFSYLAAGIEPIDAQVSQAMEQLLDAFQSIGYEAFLRALINQLHTVSNPYILVLDDYHVIRNEQIHQVIRTLLEHFPPSMQLVLITREDPPFPLSRMRVNKRLLELRISKLRFTDEEASVYLTRQLPFTLEEAQLQHLIKRTEGWIAGLQMTALYMQRLENVDAFIEAFTTSHYYIMDYLMEEVLERHSQTVKTFLLTTSILDFFSCELCDDLLELEAGASSAIIDSLVKTNSFIITTDSSHQWYRYHHLFRDLLKQRLDIQSKNELKKLHRRAGLWLQANEHGQEAIHHMLKANAFDEAAAMIECKWSEMDLQLQSASWLEMVKTLPADIIDRSPVLAMGYGWALLDLGEIEACKAWFEKAQALYDRCQAEVNPKDILVADKAQFQILPATIASAYGYIAAALGDVEGVFTHARYALERLPSNQYYQRGIVSMLLAVAHWESGDLQEAESVILQSLKSIRGFVNLLVENSFYMVLGELYIWQGDLRKSKAMFEQTIANVIEHNRVPILLASLYLGLAKVAFLEHENGKAYDLLEESRKYGQQYALMDWVYKYNLLLARVYCSESLFDLARDCIAESKSHYFMNPIPDNPTIDDVEIMLNGAVESYPPIPTVKLESPGKYGFTKEHANLSLSEPLSVRELEVIALISAGLSNQEICNTLFLALSTVKSYNQNIFGKLQVNRRTQAVVKAKALGLV